MKIQVCRFQCTFKEIEIGKITSTQWKYIDAIEEYKFRYKKAPTVRTICKLVGVSSTASVHRMLEVLKTKGYDYKCL